MLHLAFALLLSFQEPGTLQTSFQVQKCLPEAHTCTFTGNPVIVTYQDVRIESNELTVNTETYDVTSPVEVPVIFTRLDERIEGDNLDLNIKTKAGTMQHVDGHVGMEYYFKAKDVRRLDDGRYILHEAVVTTCDRPSPGWSMESHSAYIIPGERMSASGSTFRLQGFPLFYFPYVAMPSVERERSTGFLIPSTSTSTTKGRSVREEFYWAINRSADALFTGEYFTSRGPAGQVTFRAVANQNSRLEVSSFFVKDKLGQGGNSARILNYSDLGPGLRGVADMNLVSSFLFRQIFEDGLSLISSPIEHSVAYLTRDQNALNYSVVYNRTGIFYQNQPTAVTAKSPAFEGILADKQIGTLPAYFTVDGGASGISRRDAAYNTDGLLGRFDLHPVLEIPAIRTSAFEWSHDIGVRETYYSSTIQGSAYNRFLLDYSTHLVAPQLERDFGSWRHVIEPTVDYRYVNGANQFRNTVVVDNADLLTNTNEVEYGITNRFFTTREVFSWRIAQEYFLDPEFRWGDPAGNAQRLCAADGSDGICLCERAAAVFAGGFEDAPGDQSEYVDGLTGRLRHRTASLRRRRYFRRGQSWDLFRQYLVLLPQQQQHPISQRSVSWQFCLRQRTEVRFQFRDECGIDIQHRVFQQSGTQVGYNWDCYGVSLDWMQFNLGPRIESRIRFAFSLKNIGTFGNLRRQDRIF